MTHEQRAVELFKRGFNCAQAVYLACRDEDLMSEEAAILASGAFGGGVGGLEQSCGALCGATMVLSERFMPLDPTDAEQKQKARSAMQAYGQWFEQTFGTCMCSELKPLSKARGGLKTCSEYVAACAKKLSESKAPFRVCAIAHLSSEYEQELAIRQAELREPLGLNLYTEDLTHEAFCYHIGVFLKDELVGTLYLQPISEDCRQIRQVAVKKAFQGMGAGEQMMRFAECIAYEHGTKKIILHSRKTVEGFYESLGYKTVGDEIVEVGIAHVPMEKEL